MIRRASWTVATWALFGLLALVGWLSLTNWPDSLQPWWMQDAKPAADLTPVEGPAPSCAWYHTDC